MFAEDPEEASVSETDADTQDTREEQTSHDDKPWYPYITKTQFEKFLSRLQGKIPEEIDRDYVRAIIRTPSMIYRFLRGIEAMKLIDHDQRTTERLARLADKETRSEALSEIVRDLYPELLSQWEATGSQMSDRDIVSFFRKETGMGNDSANKMKMFFKYLLAESDVSPGDATANDAETGEGTDVEVQETKTPEPAETGRNGGPTRGARAERRSQGPRDRGDRGERNDRDNQSGRDRNDRDSPSGRERNERSDRDSQSGRDRGERNDRDNQSGRDRSGRDRDRDRDRDTDRHANRPLSEAQRAYLDTLKAVLRVNVDGDWDDDMIRLAFDRLERIFDRVRRG